MKYVGSGGKKFLRKLKKKMKKIEKKQSKGGVWDKVTPPTKSPLEGVAEFLKNMTPEQEAEWKKQVAERMKKMKEEEAKREHEYWHPTEKRTGVCLVCRGKVVGRVTREYRGDPMHRIIGPGGRSQMSLVHHGFHCEKCGLKYEFPPLESVRKELEEEADPEGFVDHTPENLYDDWNQPGEVSDEDE